MKKKLIYFVMSLSVALSAAAVPLAVHAYTYDTTSQTKESVKPNTSDSSVATTTTTMSSSDGSTETTETADDSAGRPARVEAYKKGLKEALSVAAKARTTERCAAAQALVKGRVTNNGKSTAARIKVYESIVSKLQEVVSSASEKGVSVTDLQANITVLQAKIVAFKATNITYQQTLMDVSMVDCKTDPTAFKAALEAARTGQQAVHTSAKDIRSYVNDTIKVTLKALKTKLDS